MRVPEVDAHCARARAAGATILSEPEDVHGQRRYLAADLEGHHLVVRDAVWLGPDSQRSSDPAGVLAFGPRGSAPMNGRQGIAVAVAVALLAVLAWQGWMLASLRAEVVALKEEVAWLRPGARARSERPESEWLARVTPRGPSRRRLRPPRARDRGPDTKPWSPRSSTPRWSVS